jgi:hypothetical protein
LRKGQRRDKAKKGCRESHGVPFNVDSQNSILT